MRDCDPETKSTVVSLGFVVLAVTACTILTWEMVSHWTMIANDEPDVETPEEGIKEAAADARQLDRA